MRKELIAHRNPKSPNSEIFRTLRTNIQFMNTNKKLKTLLVTSTFPGEGKSWVTSNLAVTFAQAGKKVVLIDADTRKGRQYTIFGVYPKPGLSNFLAEAEIDDNGNLTKNIGEYIQETEIDNLYVIAAGNVPPNPSELLVSQQMVKMLEQLKEMCDLVIIDGTPCELVADSIILSRIVDSTIIVAAHKVTKKDALERVVKNINNVGGKLAGVVINKMPTLKSGYGDKYYYYGGSSSKDKVNLNKKSGNRYSENERRHKRSASMVEKNIADLYKTRDEEKKEEQREEQREETKVEQKVEPNVVQNEDIKPKVNDEQSILEKSNAIIQQINDYIKDEKNKLQ